MVTKVKKILAAFACGTLAQQGYAVGLLDDSKASISSRTLYYDGDQRSTGGVDQRQTLTGLRLDFQSGYTQGAVGLGVDLQALAGFNLSGGSSPHDASTVNTVSPVKTDGSPVDNWSRIGGNARFKYSKTEVKAGNALAFNLPVLISNDGRLLPANFQGAAVTSNEFDNITLTGGFLNRAIGRASSNWAGIAGGGSKGSDGFTFAGGDWNVRKNLKLQYYHAQLEDYYNQNFFGLIHSLDIGVGRSLTTDLRYFKSDSDGKNGTDSRYAMRTGYNENGKIDNKTWSLAFTYKDGGHALTLGHQQVSDKSGFATVNSSNVVDGRGRPEGEGGVQSLYLYTDVMVNSFIRAGENSTFGIYSYDFAALGVPGLKAGWTYVSGKDIRGTGNTTTGRYSEWESDYRLDYVVQSGTLKGLGFTLRKGIFRTELPASTLKDQDQVRLFVNYTYALW